MNVIRLDGEMHDAKALLGAAPEGSRDGVVRARGAKRPELRPRAQGDEDGMMLVQLGARAMRDRGPASGRALAA
ncbi:MAG: hypothetical protein AB1689_13800, partial [Thermodesulfobacteriota bacterium]